MKKVILATVLTLMMLAPSMAVDAPGQPGSLLVASSKPRKDQPGPGGGPVLIIKGEGGKVTGVKKGGKGKPKDRK